MIDFSKIERAMIIVAHHDDETIACGGLIKKLTCMKKEVLVVVMTDGSTGIDNSSVYTEKNITASRKSEFENAAKVLGVRDFMFLDMACQDVKYSRESLHNIVQIIREKKPCVIITHGEDERHSDHKQTSVIVKQAAWKASECILPHLGPAHRAKMFLEFECVDILPSVDIVVSIESEYSSKIQALSCYSSQFNVISGIHDYVDGLTKVRGYQAGVSRGEAFRVVSFHPMIIS